jgi:hypothetical protein
MEARVGTRLRSPVFTAAATQVLRKCCSSWPLVEYSESTMALGFCRSAVNSGLAATAVRADSLRLSRPRFASRAGSPAPCGVVKPRSGEPASVKG